MRKDLRGACPSCGFKKPEVLAIIKKGTSVGFTTEISMVDGEPTTRGTRFVAKCPGCGLNTGPKKSYNRAVNFWNAMDDRRRVSRT